MEEILEKFCEILQRDIALKFKKLSNRAVLISSSKEKQSYHVIIRIYDKAKEYLFENNFVLAQYLKNFRERALNTLDCGKSKNKIFGIEIKEEHVADFRKLLNECLDFTVYSRNRLFRMYLSSKKGKEEKLRLCEKLTKPKDLYGDHKIWQTTMVTFPWGEDTELLDCSFLPSAPKNRMLRKRDKATAKMATPFHDGQGSETKDEVYPPHDLKDYLNKFVQGEGTVTKIQRRMGQHEFAIYTTSRECMYARRVHSSNHVYLSCDTEAKVMRHACFSSACKNIYDLEVVKDVDDAVFTKIRDLFVNDDINNVPRPTKKTRFFSLEEVPAHYQSLEFTDNF